eukprot:CAMPEP_0194206510 /NCGR_PEP_ID=MMETSP0156-20130528/5516_1 /TAXON_ID=33649 /ORGANISM="Thalassionema nitzschioides, Strain L26-B" /LENGTH=465 /DNA_ID=CAMNT_0038933043 /DNA_START=110 /DNA_END=1507 /DNA_ORIENTATION=+
MKKNSRDNNNNKSKLMEGSISLPSLDSISSKAGSIIDRFQKQRKKDASQNGYKSSNKNKPSLEHNSTLDSTSFADVSLNTIYSETVTDASHNAHQDNTDFIRKYVDSAAQEYNPNTRSGRRKRRKCRRVMETYGPGLLLFITLLMAHYTIQQSFLTPDQMMKKSKPAKKRQKQGGGAFTDTESMTLNAFMESSTLRNTASADLPTNKVKDDSMSSRKSTKVDELMHADPKERLRYQQRNEREKMELKRTQKTVDKHVLAEENRTQRQQEKENMKEKEKYLLKEMKKNPSKLRLINAVRENDFDKVKLLLQKKEDPNKEDPESGLTPFIEAILTQENPMIVAMMRYGARSQPREGFQHTPLRAAALTGNYRVMQLLLKTGANPNARSKGGRTPLMGACYLRPGIDDELSLQAVKVLLEDPRTDPALHNNLNETALDLCKIRKYEESVKLLQDAMKKAERQHQPLFV